MLHNRIKKQLSAYLDGELSSRQRKQVEKHLSKCEECSVLLEELREVSESVASLRQEAPEELWFAINANLETVSSDSQRPLVTDKRWNWERIYPVMKPLAAAATIVIVLFSAFFIWTSLHEQPKTISQDTPMDVYLTAHTQSYSRKMLAPEPVLDLVETQVNTQSNQQEQQTEYSSDVDFYLSVYMGEDEI